MAANLPVTGQNLIAPHDVPDIQQTKPNCRVHLTLRSSYSSRLDCDKGTLGTPIQQTVLRDNQSMNPSPMTNCVDANVSPSAYSEQLLLESNCYDTNCYDKNEPPQKMYGSLSDRLKVTEINQHNLSHDYQYECVNIGSGAKVREDYGNHSNQPWEGTKTGFCTKYCSRNTLVPFANTNIFDTMTQFYIKDVSYFRGLGLVAPPPPPPK